MRAIVATLFLLCAGCQNVSTSRMIFKTPTQTLEIEMPKEMVASDLDVRINAETGNVSIRAAKITTKNQGTIAAQGERERGNLDEANKITGKVVEGAVTGVLKGVVP